MNNSTKEQIGCDVICKSHSARTERDLYRICPSKLSKRELEDLYFALLENNLELKKTVNVQQDKIKVLSTRLQRMTVVQKNVTGKEKDCCTSKAVVNDQKESISDLKKMNERMAERIRLLNMRLCSAKQFLKRSPSQSTTNKTCNRCSFKNSSMSALNAKQSDSNVRSTAVSCQFLDKDVTEKIKNTVEIETDTGTPEKDNTEKPCNENKCRTMMDELREKIVNLQEELGSSHKEYSERISKLEALVSELHDENLRVRSEHVASEHELQQRVNKADQLQDKLRTADAKCNELNMELSIEKRRVAELETGLKLANMSKHVVVQTIEQLAATKEDEQEPSTELSREGSQRLECLPKNEVQRSMSKMNLKLQQSSKLPSEANTEDDSGYTELNKSCETDEDQAMVKINQELLKKIAELQMQLDLVRISAAGEAVESKETKKTKDSESYDVETEDVDDAVMNNAVDTNLVAKSVNSSDAHASQQAAAEGDKNNTERDKNNTAPEGYEADAIKPWDDHLVAGDNEKVEETDKNQNAEPSVNKPTVKVKSECKEARDDEHNNFQIPGPIPAMYPSQTSPKDKRKNSKNRENSKDSNNERQKKKVNSEEKTVKIFVNSKESYFYSDKQSKENGSASEGKSTPAAIANIEEYARDIEAEGKDDKKQKNVSITDVEAKLLDRAPRDSLYVHRKKLTDNESAMDEVKKESTTSFFIESVCTPPMSANPVDRAADQSTQVEDNADKYALCESRATICRCPALARRDVSVFRSCSGTLRFRTAPASDSLRQCGCKVQTDSSATQVEPPMSNRRDSGTFTADAAGTYTVEKQSRATSPENTDHEISSLTDLPSEKDGKPRGVPSPSVSPRALSPGERVERGGRGERGTMTCTDTETAPTDYGSLSEGEMPAGIKVRKLSDGERTFVTPPMATPSEKMEATLQSISEELARCRQLLLSQKPRESKTSQYDAPQSDLEGHALKASAGTRQIPGTRVAYCVFILHIGTLVLSDESLLYSRDKTLVLTWKFYSQNAAMTRVLAGRVVQFDFVTEYDVPFNGDFLEYMKHADMAIELCELEKPDEPLAMCSLPLREALLHANRRADMSLALVPISPGGSKDSMQEEVGVLDLWCSLRIDASLLPTIHRSMHSQSPPMLNSVSSVGNRVPGSGCALGQQAVDDDASSERLSRDLDIGSKQGRTTQSTVPELYSQRFNPKNFDRCSLAREQSSRSDREVQQYGFLPYRRRSSLTQKSLPSSDLGHKGLVGFENHLPNMRQVSSGIIINEVPASICTTDDMKQALDRNVRLNNLTRLPKMDDDPVQTHSSIGSIKTLAARHQLSKLRWTKNKSSRDRVDSLEELLKKEKGFDRGSFTEGTFRMPVTSTEGYVKDEDSERFLTKNNDTNKYIGIPGIGKLAEASKKSVKYTDSPSLEEPQKESSADSDESISQSIDITILWLALNEECEAMINSKIQRLYVAYSFLGRRGADLETPFSLPKPKHYADKCYFNFKKTFHLHECDLPLLGHMSRCRAGGGASTDPRDCIVFTLVSEPAEDPLGLSSCEDIGYAYLYLGDVLAYSGNSAGYTEVVGVRGVRGGVCGVLAVRVDQLPVLRRALSLTHSHSLRDLPRATECRNHSSMVPTFQIE